MNLFNKKIKNFYYYIKFLIIYLNKKCHLHQMKKKNKY